MTQKRFDTRAVVIVLVVAGCGGTPKTDPPAVPSGSASVASSSAAADPDCASTVAKLIKSDARNDDLASNVRTLLVDRCTEDKWSAEARRCMIAATGASDLDDCASKHLSQEQRDKSDRAISDFDRANSGGRAKTLKVTEVSPAKGDDDGGTYVVIKGSGFLNEGPRNAKVYFGSRQGTIVRFQSDSKLIVQAPGGKVGETVDVLVIFDPGGQLVLKRAFTFIEKADGGPTINDLKP